MNSSENHTLRLPDCEIQKESLRATVSDPDSRSRRTRWLRNKILFNNDDKNDSGFQDGASTHIPPVGPIRSNHISYDNLPLRDSWRSLADVLPQSLKKDFSLPNNQAIKQTGRRVGVVEDENVKTLSRRNGVRYSVKVFRSQSQTPSTISSESSAEQDECENSLDPALLIPEPLDRHTCGRKQSVFSVSYDAWSDNSVISGFRDLSPCRGSVLEAAWTGDDSALEQLLKVEETVERIRNHDILDGNGRTALHLSSACGHFGFVELLLKTGVDVNVFDTHQKSTPLACAASCGSVSVLQLLIDHGADVNAGYDSGTTSLHWAVQAGSVDCAKILLEKGAKQNPPLIYAETPLHIAAALGDSDSLKVLLEYGADVGLCKGTYKSQALHLAAEEGSASCVRLLLDYEAPMNAKDGRGHTALHLAANSDADSVSLLLGAGANSNIPDSNGRTPLHCAISRGSRAADIVRLLADNGADVDAQDDFGYAPLHLAAVQDSSQCASILLHHGADVTVKTKAGTSALSLLVRRIPDVMRYLVERLDSAVSINEFDPADPDCEIKLDFRAIVPSSEAKQQKSRADSTVFCGYQKRRKETEFLTCVLAAGNKKILSHPLSEAFLTLKWLRVRKFFWASLLFQIALLLLFTTFVIKVYLMECPYTWKRQNDTLPNASFRSDDTVGVVPFPKYNIFGFGPRTEGDGRRSSNRTGRRWKELRNFIFNASKSCPTVEPTEETKIDNNKKEKEQDIVLQVIWILLVTFTSMMAIKEIFQLLQAPLSYVFSSENWGQWALIGSVALTALRSPCSVDFDESYWQYPAASCGIFLAWGLMLLQVGRFPALGLYVQMLGKVAANFGIFILAYACLLIAFALSFSVLFSDEPAYGSPATSILKVLTMMVGEVDYEDLFYKDEDHNNLPKVYHVVAHLLHGAFVVLCTVVLMNLLVGLAVHDIQGLQKGAKLNRLSRQTALISRLESFIFSKRLQSCLPRSIGSILEESALLVPSSYKWSYYIRPNDPRDKRLPKELKLAALRLVAVRHASKRAKTRQTAFKSRKGNQMANDTDVKRIEQKLEQLQNQMQLLMDNFIANKVDK